MSKLFFNSQIVGVFFLLFFLQDSTDCFAEEKSETKSESITEYLNAFHANPASMMQRLPSEIDIHGNSYPRGFIKEESADWKKIIDYRSQLRREFLNSSETTIYDDPINDEAQDNPARIIEPGNILKNIIEMQQLNLTRGAITTLPWADSYWPIYSGIIGNRYLDRGFPNSKNWSSNFQYIQNNSALNIIQRGVEAEINILSPSEKYDFIMGDTNFTLTNHSWTKGKFYEQKYGYVPTWMGICHGWAAAAHMQMPYKRQPITIKSVNGTPVTLYPQDIKALQSMLWAYSAPGPRFAGNRCNVSSPEKNRNGRIIDSNCFDISPSTWHISVVNQIAIHQRSFIMDATYDLQVWNFPIVSYRYRYFNPESLVESADITGSMIPISDFKKDKFPEYRDPLATQIAGIYMDVTYVIEINPNRIGSDIPPPLKTIRYIYDLEMDSNNKILGGEWYSNAHPDFLWTYSTNARAKSREDARLKNDTWTIEQAVPQSWTDIARNASMRGSPLGTFLSRINQ
jgi:hypothetical protein